MLPPALPSLRGHPLADVLRAEPAQPLVTFFDDASGERTELSGTTFDNWVAKTANLLQDVLAVEPGARVALALPPHWQAAVWLVACWACGALAVPLTDPLADPLADEAAGDADVLVLPLDALGSLAKLPAGPEVVTLALRPLALPGSGVPAGVLDYDVEVRAGGDRFTPYAPVPPAAPALQLGGDVRTAADLGAAAGQRAEAAALTPADRVLVTQAYADERSVLDGLLAPLAAGSSLVLCRHPSPPLLPGRAATERVTVVLGTHAELLSSEQVRAL
ncbi:MAG: TIGR03089 family protein [Actinomycetota bacterium]|nr:TIGR03089 family protein [Actinomycetota bacterium]